MRNNEQSRRMRAAGWTSSAAYPEIAKWSARSLGSSRDPDALRALEAFRAAGWFEIITQEVDVQWDIDLLCDYAEEAGQPFSNWCMIYVSPSWHFLFRNDEDAIKVRLLFAL